jgi:hypothetical protein
MNIDVHYERVNLIGVSKNPKVLQAITGAATSRGQTFQVGSDLADLPSLLDDIDVNSYTFVFLDYLPHPAPELVQAAKLIHSKVAAGRIYLLAEKAPVGWPDEWFEVGLMALLEPPFRTSMFQRMIDGVNARAGD